MFKPTKKNSFKETIKDYLLKGYVLRYDAQGENPLEGEHGYGMLKFGNTTDGWENLLVNWLKHL